MAIRQLDTITTHGCGNGNGGSSKLGSFCSRQSHIKAALSVVLDRFQGARKIGDGEALNGSDRPGRALNAGKASIGSTDVGQQHRVRGGGLHGWTYVVQS
jgi:hypothetical protein